MIIKIANVEMSPVAYQVKKPLGLPTLRCLEDSPICTFNPAVEAVDDSPSTWIPDTHTGDNT